ncbi:MAG TPA: hypothetical protein VNB06_20110 [Thermoanaerobaculia bacterium]|nr:hypothetical protein [Thermoanaerobaculia bacterium]
MDMKYADVVALDEVIGYVESLTTGLFDEQMPALEQHHVSPSGVSASDRANMRPWKPDAMHRDGGTDPSS